MRKGLIQTSVALRVKSKEPTLDDAQNALRGVARRLGKLAEQGFVLNSVDALPGNFEFHLSRIAKSRNDDILDETLEGYLVEEPIFTAMRRKKVATVRDLARRTPEQLDLKKRTWAYKELDELLAHFGLSWGMKNI